MAKRATAATVVTIAAPLRLAADSPLPIRVEQAQLLTRPTHWGWWAFRGIFTALFIASLIFALRYAVPKPPVQPTPLLAGLSVGYTAPQSVATDDEETIAVSVLNGATEAMTVTLALVFADSSLPVAAPAGETTAVTIENLPPGAIATRAIRFVLKGRPDIDRFNFVIRTTLLDGSSQDTDEDTVEVTPIIPRLKAILTWLTSTSGILALLGKSIWDRAVKRLLLLD